MTIYYNNNTPYDNFIKTICYNNNTPYDYIIKTVCYNNYTPYDYIIKTICYNNNTPYDYIIMTKDLSIMRRKISFSAEALCVFRGNPRTRHFYIKSRNFNYN